MAEQKVLSAGVSQFLGMRTDVIASKCPAPYFPDCAELTFKPGSFATRNPFVVVHTAPAEIVFRKEFSSRDGSMQEVALDINGVLYSVSGDAYTAISNVFPGSRVSSVTANGREYMAFFNDAGGSDMPLQWDGHKLRRVSQGGPGAPPTVSNLSLPAVQLVAGSEGAAIAIDIVTPDDPQEVQVGGGGYDPDGGRYNPPVVETYYTTLDVVTTSDHGFIVGDSVSITGNSLWNFSVAYVSSVISATEFKVSYQQQDSAVGTGGNAAAGTSLLVRKENVVQAYTATAHGLRQGYQAQITGISPSVIGGSVTSIVIDQDTPTVATITTSVAHGLVPSNTVSLANVSPVTVGGSITFSQTANATQTVTTASDHGLTVNAHVLLQTGSNPVSPAIVTSIITPTQFTVDNLGADGSDTTGSVQLVFYPDTTTEYEVESVPSPTTFTVSTGYVPGTWTSGTLTYPWNGTFYVLNVSSATSFSYSQTGPDASLQTGTGTVTPRGQVSAGDHQVTQSFLTDTGFLTAPSPPARFTANGGSYLLIQDLAVGPSNVIARVLEFTGAFGSKFFCLLAPSQVNGVQVSTSTRVDDNVTTSVIVDFSDNSLLSGTGIDIPGNNLFRQVPLDTPAGVEWYSSRLIWWGLKNEAVNLVNMGMDGGVLSGSSAPLGWKQVDTSGSIVQSGVTTVYRISGGSGEIQQGVTRNFYGVQVLDTNQLYRLRFRASGNNTILATLSSASASFTSTATAVVSGYGYFTADFTEKTPTTIPDDLILSIKATGTSQIDINAVQLIYADNPNIQAGRMSYVNNLEAFDGLTGPIGPEDDSTELRAAFVLQEQLYLITAARLYSANQVGNVEPSSWNPQQVADRCGAFHANAVTVGTGWAAWGGNTGFFWFSGGIPTKVSKTIKPTWAQVSSLTNVRNDTDAERVYIGTLDTAGNKSMLVMDYHEDDTFKWCQWKRPVGWMSRSSTEGTLFAFSNYMMKLSDEEGTADEQMGDIGGYAQFAPLVASMFRKTAQGLFFRMSGTGTVAPKMRYKTLSDTPELLNSFDLSKAQDVVLEWPLNAIGRLFFTRIGDPGAAFEMEEMALSYVLDPNAPVAGVR